MSPTLGSSHCLPGLGGGGRQEQPPLVRGACRTAPRRQRFAVLWIRAAAAGSQTLRCNYLCLITVPGAGLSQGLLLTGSFPCSPGLLSVCRALCPQPGRSEGPFMLPFIPVGHVPDLPAEPRGMFLGSRYWAAASQGGLRGSLMTVPCGVASSHCCSAGSW